MILKITENKLKKENLFLGLALLIALISISGAYSQESSYCCEKTLNGAWCQNDILENCDSNFKTSPTSCESTSYCKRGCCFDSQEGICMESTPQRVCEDEKENGIAGTWADNEMCNIVQCNLGCCILGDQAAFVTMTRCKELSSSYGLKIDFRSSIQSEVSCIETAQGEDRGACVKQDANLAPTCTFTTRSGCKEDSVDLDLNSSRNKTKVASPGFYKDVLCSAEDLGNICGPSKKTTIIDGKDEVYYLDSCNNIANIYDSSKFDDDEYWRKVYKKSESCGYGSSNANSKSCGNCDYFLGSIAKKKTGVLGNPDYGDYICADLGCKDQGKRHGESWCVKDSPNGQGKDTVGSRYYKEVCLFNEVITESCADYRNQICIEDEFNGFSEAACRTNRWQDCTAQVEQDDCENVDIRDCMWMEGYYFSQTSGQVEKSYTGEDEDLLTPTGLCLPNYPPGFQFWSSGQTTGTSGNSGRFNVTTSFGTGYVNPSSTGTSSGSCNLGNAKVTIKWEKKEKPVDWLGLFGGDGDWECANDECKKYDKDPKQAKITDEEAKAWAGDMNEICYRLGDCGGYVNWKGKYTDDGYAAYNDGKRLAGSGGSEILEKQKTAGQTDNAGAQTPSSGIGGLTGNIVKDLIKKVVGN